MKKPYAESTLRRKYAQTGIELDKIRTVDIFLRACSNFYKVIELEEAWKMIGEKVKALGGVSRSDFDKLIPIIGRDRHTSYYLELESELYADGKDELLLINKDYLFKANEDFTEADLAEIQRCVENGLPYEGPSPGDVDWDRFYELDGMRQGKGLYIPDKLLWYADSEFVDETPQVEAMRKFLLELELEIPQEMQEEAKTWPAKKKRIELQTFRELGAKETILEMLCVMQDIAVSPSQAFPLMLEKMSGYGYSINSFDQIQKLMELFTDLSNNTRMPSNAGYTPNELMQKMRRESGSDITGGFPRSLSFGPGIVNGIRNGDIDGNELKRMIMGSQDIPYETAVELLKEIDKAMK